jgi:peptide/nickel transport system permease protein
MGRYIIRRLLWSVLVVLIVTFVTFIVFFVIPSADPARVRAGRQPTPALIAQIRHNLGLDRSFLYQYGHFLDRLVFHADLGTSYATQASVKSGIIDRLPVTFSLAIGAMVIWFVAGVFVGIISAVRRRSWLDRVAMGGALLAISAPIYWLGLVSLYLFDKQIGKFHVFNAYGSYTSISHGFFKWAGALILPWLVLSASFAAVYARLLRGNLLDTLGQDYVRTARAKGLTETRVVMRHAVRSAITPIVTVLGLDLGLLLAGNTILTETVFNMQGVGRYAYNAIQGSDLPVIQGTVVFGTLFIVVMNLVVDIAYAFLDPRVRYS